MRRLNTSPLPIIAAFALVVSLSLSLSLSLSGSAFAQPPQRSPGFPAGLAEARLIREMHEEIGVDEKTLEKLEKLVEEIRTEEAALKGKVVEAHAKTSALLDQSMPDEKELMAAVGAASVLARATREHRVMASLRIRALLTEGQLALFMDIRKKTITKRTEKKKKRARPPGK
jgi:Spy/CpxP family protein refolding chaperone